MTEYRKIIFVCQDNTCRSPMAELLMKNRMKDMNVEADIEITSRGIVVLFPEPRNPKMIQVLRNNGLNVGNNNEAVALSSEDFSEDTLVLTMTLEQKQKIYEEYDNAVNVFSLPEYVGEAENIEVPYGGDIDEYTQLFINLTYFVCMLADKLFKETEE